jgi:hypothetical protein
VCRHNERDRAGALQRREAIDLDAGRRGGGIRASGWPAPVAVGRVASDDPLAVIFGRLIGGDRTARHETILDASI